MKTTIIKITAGTYIALLLMAGNVKAEGTKVKATTQAIETSLQVEKWMTDEAIWNKKSFIKYEITEETETGLEIEDWMTNEETWNFNNNFAEEIETKLKVETWMTDNNIWNRE